MKHRNSFCVIDQLIDFQLSSSVCVKVKNIWEINMEKYKGLIICIIISILCLNVSNTWDLRSLDFDIVRRCVLFWTLVKTSPCIKKSGWWLYTLTLAL